jgi:hypothetical protein
MRRVPVWGVVGKALDTNRLAIRMTPDGTANGSSDRIRLSPAQKGNQFFWQRFQAHSSVLLEKLTVAQSLHYSPPLNPILSQMKQSALHHISVNCILVLFSHLSLGLPNGLFPSAFPTKTCMHLPCKESCSIQEKDEGRRWDLTFSRH